jgi:hypothetical protein
MNDAETIVHSLPYPVSVDALCAADKTLKRKYPNKHIYCRDGDVNGVKSLVFVMVAHTADDKFACDCGRVESGRHHALCPAVNKRGTP